MPSTLPTTATTALRPAASSASFGMAPQPEPSVAPLWRPLLRYRWLVLGCTVTVVAAAAVATRYVKPRYEVTTSLRIDERQTTLPAMDVMQSLATRSELNTDIEELASRVLAQHVVDSLGLQLQLEEPSGVSRAQLFTNVTTTPAAANDVARAYSLLRSRQGQFLLRDRRSGRLLATIPPLGQIDLDGVHFALTAAAAAYPEIRFRVNTRDETTDALHEDVEIVRPGAGREMNIVGLRYRSSDPQLATAVLNAFTTRFIQQQQDAKRAGIRSTATFLRGQLDQLSKRLAAQQDSLRAFRQNQRVLSLPDEERTQVDRLSQLTAERNQVETERSALSQLYESVMKEAATRKPTDPSPFRRLMAYPTLMHSDVSIQLLASLTAAEDKRADLLTRRTMSDPDVQQVTGRIHEIEEQIQGVASAYLQGLTNHLSAIDAVQGQAQAVASAMPEREIKYDQLEREPKVLEQMYTMLQMRLQEAQVAEASLYSAVRVVDPAVVPTEPVSPKLAINLMLALVAGLLVGMSGAYVLEHRDQTVHSRHDVQLATGHAVLGLIPHASRPASWLAPAQPRRGRLRGIASVHPTGSEHDGDATGTGKSADDARSRARLPDAVQLEAYNRLALNLAFASADRPLRTLVVTSPLPGDGKTTVATNLAVTLAHRDRRVLLIDADLRRGSLHTLFGVRREPGLADVLGRGADIETALRHVRCGGVELDLMPAGSAPADPAALFAGSERLIEALEARYDTIILDTAPLNVVSDAALLSTPQRGVLLVARSGRTIPGALAFALEQLQHVHAQVVGTILNDIRVERDVYHDPAYAYYAKDARDYLGTNG